MLAKSFLYVGEKNCMLVKNLNRKLNVCWWSMLVKNFLYVGEHFEQKFKCMLVKYVGEKFYVCWWKVPSRKNISFHQHTFFTNILHQHKNSHFSPTSFTNIRTAIKITYTTYELHQKIHSKNIRIVSIEYKIEMEIFTIRIIFWNENSRDLFKQLVNRSE